MFSARRPTLTAATTAASPAPPATRRRSGFSLLEVLVAMILIIIAAVSVASYTLTVTSTRVISRQKELAMVAVQETMDSVRALGYGGATVGTFQRNRTVGDVALNVQATVAQSQPTSKVVDIAVTNSGGTLLQRFITSLYDESR